MLSRHAMVCARSAAAATTVVTWSTGVVSPQVHPAARAPPPRHLHRRRSARVRVRVRASGDDDDGTWRWLRHTYLFSLLAASSAFLTCCLSVADAPSDANTALDFKRELQRRGITSAQTEQLKAKQPAGDAQPDTSQPRRRVQPPRWASETPESLAQSRALGAEGLEGLIPRATQLLRLAFGFWIPFWPFMAVFSALFTLTYVLFGDFFLHSVRCSPPIFLLFHLPADKCHGARALAVGRLL
jgi:hypothetical protein